MPNVKLRVFDAGTVSALRSQSLWHGIAAAMHREAAPILSFCHPGAPYVCLGYHRHLDEIDRTACRGLGLPVLRRQIGGGPVYVDEDQLFFQITLPAHLAPRSVESLYELLLEPAVSAFRALGLEAHRRGINDIAVEDRKISGTGAGQIEDGVTVVGNVLFRFPHQRMVSILALPSEGMRRECSRLLCRHVSSLASEGLVGADSKGAKEALVEAYAQHLGLQPVIDVLTDDEEAAIDRWEQRMLDPSWLEGSPRRRQSWCQVKISSDVWLFAASGDGMTVEASIVGGRIEHASIRSERADGTAAGMKHALVGQPSESVAIRRSLEVFGQAGRRAAELLEPGLRLH